MIAPRRIPRSDRIERCSSRLRHGAIVSRHNQQRVINRADAGDHRVNEPIVSRDIDEAQHDIVVAAPIGETEIDGHAATLFFRQAVGIDAGQGGHQRGLAVIDMSGGGHDHWSDDVSSGAEVFKLL